MSQHDSIIKLLPYAKPFLFVDTIDEVSDEAICGTYTFKEDEYFLAGHFPGNPIVPGVIVTEAMAQVGLVCLGIHLQSKEELQETVPVFTNSEVEFLKKVLPGDKLIIDSQKVYFRLGKLKCRVRCSLPDGTVVAKGVLSGMMLNKSKV